jgi:S-DNA-T family DNA segregation ATPase FtsK/SpoIIIE
MAPVVVELKDGGVVGIVGHRASALGLARALLCQAAVQHGPADLTVATFVDHGRASEWDWVKWLPHTRRAEGGPGARWLGEGREVGDGLCRDLAGGQGAPLVLAVIDSDTMTEGLGAPARELLRNAGDRTPGGATPVHRVSGVVIASTADRLPSSCTAILEVNHDLEATLTLPDEGRKVWDVLVAVVGGPDARRCALDLARFEDPETQVAGADLPDLVRLLPLLSLPAVDADSVRARWRLGDPMSPTAPIGVTESGVHVLNLVEDGPHGLIGGTTGSGKSELLRSLVVALAAGTDPRFLNFVLVDYKGGAAFGECARLPHTVGMVTDLDEQLSERALEALDAELDRRERAFFAAGVDTITDYERRATGERFARLAVVIDEFATLKEDLPGFMAALVGVAQRGRSLGVHLLLATQRPSGSVSEDIEANTNVRVALRMQKGQESTDVIGRADAAQIDRRHRGRAYLRLGPQDVVPLQTALVKCVTEEDTDIAVGVTSFAFAPVPATNESPIVPLEDRAERAWEAPTDLARLVDAIEAAAVAEKIPAPRRPWPEPLAEEVPLASVLGEREGTVTFAMADDPQRQEQYPVGWDPAKGNLSLFGAVGSGTTTALAALALGLATHHRPEDLHLQVMDFGTGELAALAALPHVGSVAVGGEPDRQLRLIRYTIAEHDRRRSAGPEHGRPPLVLLVDNFAAMRAAIGDDVDGHDLTAAFSRVVADGGALGISVVLTADRVGVVPPAFVTPHRWTFRLNERGDYSTAGLARDRVPPGIPGRAAVVATGQHVQVGLPGPLSQAVAEVIGRHPGGVRTAATIRSLSADVSLSTLAVAPLVGTEPWSVPVGVAEVDLEPAAVQLYEGEHLLVAGPARSGRSTALLTLAAQFRRADAVVRVVGIAGRRSPLRDAGLDELASTDGEIAVLAAKLHARRGPTVLLVDDADSVEDGDKALETLLHRPNPDLHVIAAGNNEALRGLYSGWTRTLRRSKSGILLRPTVDLDGDLLGAKLPRTSRVPFTTGRGYLVQNGDPTLVQLARA